MAEKKARSQSVNLTFDHKNLGISLNYVCVGGVPNIIEKLLTKATILLQISPQLEVYTRSYRRPNWWKFQFREFWDS
jgi:hypothetical protein